MRGWTARVGLRKPELECADCWIRNETCTHPELALAEIQANRRHKAHGTQPDPECPCSWPGEPGARKVRPSAGLMDTIRQAMATVTVLPAYEHDCVCGGCDPDDGPVDALVERQEQRRRDESLRAAKAKVGALPADQRARLEGEFQRAEQEAAAIMRHGRHDAVYRAAELRLHEAALECANAVYDKIGLRTIDLLDAVMDYARVVKTSQLPSAPRPCCHTTGPNHHPTCQEAAVNCWDKHPRTGIVANADPRSDAPYDGSRAYHARACCDRPRCIAAAKGQVRIHTGEPGIYFPDPERKATR